MAHRGMLLALLPALGLGFTPPVPGLVAGSLSVSSQSCTHMNAVSQPTAFAGSPVRASARSRTASLSMSLVEQPVTAEEAVELITKAKTIVDADMGVKARGMLSEDFRFLWQFNGELSRKEYLTPGKGPYATLRTALPDLFWNSYDFRVDKYESNRVWATTRMTGTHNGQLVFDGKEFPATGARVEAAPECVSLVFDKESGLCTKMTGGFCIDKGVGNTGPAGGIWGVLQAIGEPVSAWKHFPPAKVLGDVIGPTFRGKKSPGAVKAPFRDAIAIALAKQVLTAGRDDPDSVSDLLANDVQVYAPILGPLKKKEFVKSATVDLTDFFSGLDVEDNFYDARVDPFEPSRVWITTRPTTKVVGPLECFGTKFVPKRESYTAGPECLSVTFDQDGFASKITLGCPMDTELGETDGLCNFLGILAGLGIPAPDFFSRPAPESFRKLVDSIRPKKKAVKTTKAKAKAKPAAVSAKPAAPAAKTKKTTPAAAAPPRAAVKAPPTSPKPAFMGRPPASKPAPKVVAKPPAKPATAKPAPRAAMTKPKPAAPKMAAPKTKAVAATPKAAASASTSRGSSRKTAPVKAKPASTSRATKGGDKSKTSPVGSKPSSSPSSPSPFGGMFNFGGGSSSSNTKKKSAGEEETATAVTGAGRKQAPKKAPAKAAASASAPAPAAPAKKKAAPVAAKPAAAVRVAFSPQLSAKLEEALGSSGALDRLSKRTELYARGGISAMDYWSTLKKALGPDGAQNLGPDIIGALPSGNQKSALFKIFSTTG